MKERNENFSFSSFEPWCILNHVVRNLWMVVVGALVCMMLSGIYVQLFCHNTYGSRLTYVVQSRVSSTAASKTTAASTVAETFSELLKSDFIHNQVTRSAGLTSFDGTISAESPSGTNIVTITVTASTAREAFLISNAISNNKAELMRYIYNGATLNLLNAPVSYTISGMRFSASRTGLLSAIVGALLIIAVLMLDMYFSDTVQTAAAARAKLDARVLLTIRHEGSSLDALIPVLRRRKKRKGPLLITDPTASFAFSESIFRLRSQVETQQITAGSKVFLMTSVMENEGKSTVSQNLAISLAQKGKDVLLIDCDFRKPSRYRLGKTCVLKSEFQCDGVNLVLAEDTRWKMDLIFAKEMIRNSSEHLSSQDFAELILSCREKCDYIILDSPPLELFSDAEQLADLADASVMVIRQDVVPAPVLNDATEMLESRKAAFMGCVFNDEHRLLPESVGSYGYGGYSKYGKYGYGVKSPSGSRSAKAASRSQSKPQPNPQPKQPEGKEAGK